MFNNFIAAVKLTEIPPSNGRFSWSREGNAISCSLFDRFLISNTWDVIYLQILELPVKHELFLIISPFCLKQDPLSGVPLHSDFVVVG